MLTLKPIPEDKADAQTQKIYHSIKNALSTDSVPLIFQYLANFHSYFFYLWEQARKNLADNNFRRQSDEIKNFSQTAMDQIYKPSESTKIFLEGIEGTGENHELSKFTNSALHLYSSLYLLSLAIRESIKGIYLGIKQIGERMNESDKSVFDDLSEGFTSEINSKYDYPEKTVGNELLKHETSITKMPGGGLTKNVYSEFFRLMDMEMKNLIKEEAYLVRRVELERFTLSQLHFLPHPLESSFPTVIRQTSHLPGFPELVYLVADLFPTQAPYKLLATSVMQKALNRSVGNYSQTLLNKT
ncbi:hypothetical protein M1271_01660 [Patescibacteria group bacterium]|nr:hypothetical protein [Patescibacteria group bacterium]MCL5798063.1 hypothetical protein [Patescibacteria group bacterium]